MEMDQAGGIPWVIIHGGIVILALVIAYGIFRSRRLSPRQKAAQQRATHDNFRVDQDEA
jgi:hypothetical protein